MTKTTPIVGIDLGTTNSAVAIITDGHAQIIEDHDNGILPSCVGFDADGVLMVGMEARNQAVVAPDRTVLSVKRLMGRDEKICVGEESLSPQEISALILKSLKARAEKHLGVPVSQAVITVPAYFTDAQRQATRQAGELAGLQVLRIINEPTAAALAYESVQSNESRVLVYDLGGGTFDVSLVKIEEGVVEVLASTGDNHLGGDDFDEMLVAHLLEILRKEKGTDLSKDSFVTARLRRAAEEAKIALSTVPYVRIEEDHLARLKDGTDVHLSCEVSREELEVLIEPAIDTTMEAVSRAMGDAGLGPSDLDRIILVGGSTRIPMISRMLEERLGLTPHAEIDPDLCVALGAGIQAGREMGMENASVLIDITPYTFGTSALGEVNGQIVPNQFAPIIKKHTRLPATRSDVFYTMVDGQKGVNISVYQGEHTNALDNIRIGNFFFKLSGLKEGTPVVLTYDLDLNGILKLEAVEKPTGKKIKGVIENALSGYEDGNLAESRDRLDGLWGEEEPLGSPEGAESNPEKSEKPELPAVIAETLAEAEAKMENAPEEDRDEMVNLVEDIQVAFREGRRADAEALHLELEDLLFYID